MNIHSGLCLHEDKSFNVFIYLYLVINNIFFLTSISLEYNSFSSLQVLYINKATSLSSFSDGRKDALNTSSNLCLNVINVVRIQNACARRESYSLLNADDLFSKRCSFMLCFSFQILKGNDNIGWIRQCRWWKPYWTYKNVYTTTATTAAAAAIATAGTTPCPSYPMMTSCWIFPSVCRILDRYYQLIVWRNVHDPKRFLLMVSICLNFAQPLLRESSQSWRCPWCNGYRHRVWTLRYEFNSWTRLIAFHIALITLGKVWIQLFSLQLWVNSRAD